VLLSLTQTRGQEPGVSLLGQQEKSGHNPSPSIQVILTGFSIFKLTSNIPWLLFTYRLDKFRPFPKCTTTRQVCSALPVSQESQPPPPLLLGFRSTKCLTSLASSKAWCFSLPIPKRSNSPESFPHRGEACPGPLTESSSRKGVKQLLSLTLL